MVASRFDEREIYNQWDRVIDLAGLAKFPDSLEALSGSGE